MGSVAQDIKLAVRAIWKSPLPAIVVVSTLALGIGADTVMGLFAGLILPLALVGVYGVLIGLAGALALGRVLSSLLFGVGPHDPTTLIGAIASLMLASAIAAYLPARKAASIEPIRTLKYE